MSVDRIACWAGSLRFSHYASNVAEGAKIWMFWNNELSFSLTSSSDQMISGWFSLGNVQVLTSFVYASCFQRRRRKLWEQLRLIVSERYGWLVGGDFNTVRSNDEKHGGVY